MVFQFMSFSSLSLLLKHLWLIFEATYLRHTMFFITDNIATTECIMVRTNTNLLHNVSNKTTRYMYILLQNSNTHLYVHIVVQSASAVWSVHASVSVQDLIVWTAACLLAGHITADWTGGWWTGFGTPASTGIIHCVLWTLECWW